MLNHVSLALVCQSLLFHKICIRFAAAVPEWLQNNPKQQLQVKMNKMAVSLKAGQGEIWN